MPTKKSRKIPSVMATQHPDNASAPYWETDGDAFVSAQEELAECMSAYQDLGVDEYMWDWEGKHADEAVIDKMFTEYHDWCQKNKIGKDHFLTFRVPNVWHEKGYSLIRALMVILTSEDFARDLKFRHRPLFELILPMTEKAEQLIYIQNSFRALARFKNKTFFHYDGVNSDRVEIIPLVETVEGQMRIGGLLEKYWHLHHRYFKFNPPYLRVFLARSDPALMSGLIATVLANRLALTAIAEFSARRHLPVYPIIGVGCLPFRGGLTPGSVADFFRQYAGVKTVTIQSGFRYDYSLKEVKRGLSAVKKIAPHSKIDPVDAADCSRLEKIVKLGAEIYQATVSKLSVSMTPFFEAVPKRRERRLHVGILSYNRKLGKTRLPRAINFAAAFYSLGIPPEFIGLGRTLATLSPADLALVFRYYPNLKKDLAVAGRFLNRSNLVELASSDEVWKSVARDVELAENMLSLEFYPRTVEEKLHQRLSSRVLLLKRRRDKLSALIVETGKLRKSLG